MFSWNFRCLNIQYCINSLLAIAHLKLKREEKEVENTTVN